MSQPAGKAWAADGAGRGCRKAWRGGEGRMGWKPWHRRALPLLDPSPGPLGTAGEASGPTKLARPAGVLGSLEGAGLTEMGAGQRCREVPSGLEGGEGGLSSEGEPRGAEGSQAAEAAVAAAAGEVGLRNRSRAQVLTEAPGSGCGLPAHLRGQRQTGSRAAGPACGLALGSGLAVRRVTKETASPLASGSRSQTHSRSGA